MLDRASRGWRGLTMTPTGTRLLQDLRRRSLTHPVNYAHANGEHLPTKQTTRASPPRSEPPARLNKGSADSGTAYGQPIDTLPRFTNGDLVTAAQHVAGALRRGDQHECRE